MNAQFHISPTGDDSNPGTLEKPFATFVRARDAVRRLRQEQPDRDVTVLLRGGTYRLTQTVIFALEDSAAPGRTITYANYPGELPVLSGGASVCGWRRLAALPAGVPAAAAGHLWAAELPAGITNCKTLYAGEQRLARARGKGFTPLSASDTWKPADNTEMRFPGEVLRNWPDLAEGELVIIPHFPWSMNILPLASVDEPSATARTRVPGTYPLTAPCFGRFPASAWVENVMAALDQPGTWLCNSRTRTLYYWPEQSEPGDGIVAPALTELIRIEGRIDYDQPTDVPVQGLVFRGLTFLHGDRYTLAPDWEGKGVQHNWEMFDVPSAMVRLRGAERCVIDRCRFAAAGSTAVRLDLHCRGNRLTGNLIEHVGGSGVLLAGYGLGAKDVNRGNEVADNHIRHIGELYWQSPAVFVWQSGENRIAGNLIEHVPYAGIVVSGRIEWDRAGRGECSRTVRWSEVDRLLGSAYAKPPDWRVREPLMHGRRNVVERNDIRDLVETLTDGNGIYISGAGGGNIVRENFVHDSPSMRITEGIRCDDDQHDTLVERNIVWRIGGLATCIAIKGVTTVVNNIMAEPLTPPYGGMFSLEHGSAAGSVVARNLFFSTRGGDKICRQGKTIYGDEAWVQDCRADCNLYWNTTDPRWAEAFLDAARSKGVERGSVVADPLFVDPAAGDFRIRPGSPAFDLGFQPIDLSRIGLREPAGPGVV